MKVSLAQKWECWFKPGLQSIFVLALSQVMGGAVLAGQPAQDSPAVPAARSNSVAHFHNSTPAMTNSVPIVPTPPPPRSPVQYFRELLAMSPADRMRSLSSREPDNRKLLLAKIREYLSLGQNERELRLRATELEWCLVPLMRTAPADRSARMAIIPEEDRKMIESRLAEWDQLPGSVRNELLNKRQSIRLYMQMTSGLTPQTNSQAARKSVVEEDLKRIEAMSEPDRQKLVSRFNQFFALTDSEKQKALRTLSPPEQEQLEKTLRKFRNLSAAQRAQCIRSFEQFARMSGTERQQFLKNAERWIIMTPEQRQAWRDVVEKVSISPPAFASSPKPPMVPVGSRRGEPATNGN